MIHNLASQGALSLASSSLTPLERVGVFFFLFFGIMILLVLFGDRDK